MNNVNEISKDKYKNETSHDMNQDVPEYVIPECVRPNDASSISSDSSTYDSDQDAPNMVLHLRGLETIQKCTEKHKSLKLVSNRIKKIDNLEDAINLRHLDLYQNRIKVIENINHLSRLKILDLSFNKIKKIEVVVICWLYLFTRY